MKIMKSRFVWIIISIGALIALASCLGITRYVSLETIKMHMQTFKRCVEHNYLESVIVYVAVLAGIAAISLPIILFYVLLGGFLFGTWAGAAYSVLGVTIGSALSFVAIRYLLKGLLQQRYQGQLASFNGDMKAHGIWYLLVLHFLTVVPLFIINTLAALAPISLMQFIFVTIAGCGPLFIVYSFAGRELGSIRAAKDIFSPQVILACVLLVVLSLLPVVIKKIRKKNSKDHAQS